MKSRSMGAAVPSTDDFGAPLAAADGGVAVTGAAEWCVAAAGVGVLTEATAAGPRGAPAGGVAVPVRGAALGGAALAVIADAARGTAEAVANRDGGGVAATGASRQSRPSRPERKAGIDRRFYWQLVQRFDCRARGCFHQLKLPMPSGQDLRDGSHNGRSPLDFVTHVSFGGFSGSAGCFCAFYVVTTSRTRGI
jgi:hypothetical protein